VRGSTYADVRVMDIRQRDLSTKNGQVGTLSETESLGIGVRVIAAGAWGFASSDRLTREGVEACAAQAVAIARASALAKRQDVMMVPEGAYIDTWKSPCRTDPFRIALEQQLDLLMAADKEMGKVAGVRTILLDGSQLGLQVHESIGHPIELDRVLGMEANFAGLSFLTLEKLNNLRYGSDIVNVVADARIEHGPGLGTFGYDDEGVPAQCTDIIKNGLFTGYLSNRETAAASGAPRSGGTMRAESWNRLPIIRMTHVRLLPG